MWENLASGSDAGLLDKYREEACLLIYISLN